ncbi:endolysin [Proteus phage Vb_PmiP-P59]|uniref:Endolysin endopeptidase n=2 Tax=Privateervirus TaxID=2843440 RepID=A0A7L7SS21_9CAUD|nr:endolysin [Proteus phage Vb_PmiP-P59]YP_010672309.1 endolysin [Proteus phage 3H10_20]QMV48232.1 L-alanyl-D-glutamate peptidase [Proteus phage Vb_PmiP-P59]QOC54832.1 endolysin endopeptidase [Proteus phage 3H10_20]
MSNVKLSNTGKERLSSVNEKLQKVVLKSFEYMPFDITITEGIRTIEKQKEYVNKGVSWTMNSKHITGNAIDMVPYPIDWKDRARFEKMAIAMFKASEELDIPIRWGGTWSNKVDGWIYNKKLDMPHFELI